jgi:molybdopterin molybdotransferase
MSDPCFSSPDLISVEQAIGFLLDKASPAIEKEVLPLRQALGRVLANDVVSAIMVPPNDNTAMDGYVVRYQDLNQDGETVLPISQRIPAGSNPVPLEAGTAARIFTGAPIPDGADTVIMQEQCQQKGDDIVITGNIKQGDHIRRAGEDINKADVVLAAGRKLLPQDLGLAASVGCSQLEVFNKIRVAIFSTGDELLEPGDEPQPGKIYNSNRYTLNALLESTACEVIDLGVVKDTLDATTAAMRKAAEQADLVMTTGGVSVGEEDYVRAALEQTGSVNMWRVAMKPGKPFVFGYVDKTPFIGLPGNPVSVFVTFLLFAKPWIQKSQGMTDVLPIATKAKAGFDWNKKGPRREYTRAQLEAAEDGMPIARLYRSQSSGVLTSTSWAHGLVVIKENQSVSEGDLVDYYSFKGLLG